MWLHGTCAASTTGEMHGDVGVSPAPLARSLPRMHETRQCILREPLTSSAAIASCETA